VDGQGRLGFFAPPCDQTLLFHPEEDRFDRVGLAEPEALSLVVVDELCEELEPCAVVASRRRIGLRVLSLNKVTSPESIFGDANEVYEGLGVAGFEKVTFRNALNGISTAPTPSTTTTIPRLPSLTSFEPRT
jgi:hypothetical protein